MIFDKRLCRYMMHGSFQKLEAVRSWMVPNGSMLHSCDQNVGSRRVRNSPCLFWIPFVCRFFFWRKIEVVGAIAMSQLLFG